MSPPSIFISHRHADTRIARTIGTFIRRSTAGNVRIHLSSSPDFEGPRFAKPINQELKAALAECELVILVYTSEHEDWSYCTWECGVATDPSDQRYTAIAVVQCTAAHPKPFGDQLRVDATDPESVYAFARALLTTTELFADRTQPLTGFAPEGAEIKALASDLFTQLAEVLPDDSLRGRRVPAAPYLRVRLEHDAVARVRTAHDDNDLQGLLDTIAASATIMTQDGATGLLGMVLNIGSTIGDVLHVWQRRPVNADQEPRWFTSLARQLETALYGHLRPVDWAPYAATRGRADVPFVASSRAVAEGVDFDVFMVPIAPRPVRVREQMLRITEAFRKDAAEVSFDQLPLRTLVGEMTARDATRLPILQAGRPSSILHRATINEFVAQQALETGTVDGLTLADLMTAYADRLQTSYVAVPPNATMEEAMDLMIARSDCQDVYVVEDGNVVGWLTNIMFIEETG